MNSVFKSRDTEKERERERERVPRLTPSSSIEFKEKKVLILWYTISKLQKD